MRPDLKLDIMLRYNFQNISIKRIISLMDDDSDMDLGYVIL